MRSISGNPFGISQRVSSRQGFPKMIVLVVLAMTKARLLLVSEALSSSSSFSSSSLSSSGEPSPWASSSWILELDFGRPTKANQEETPTTSFSNTIPFSSFGKSGSRLVVTCPVVIEAQDDVQKTPDTFVGRGASVIRAREETDKEDGELANNSNNNDFRYITMEGSKRIEFAPGGWTLRFPPGGTKNRGRASKLRFYFDLTVDLERNDVKLPAGTRLYFAASAWREQDFEAGIVKVFPLQAVLKASQAVLDENLSHETGDRRLDGTDPLETLKAYKDMTALVLDRDRKRATLQEALDQDGHGYPASQDLPEGPWPGATEWLTLSEANPIYARVPTDSKKGNVLQQFMSGGDTQYSYGRVGTWTGEAISSLLLDDDE